MDLTARVAQNRTCPRCGHTEFYRAGDPVGCRECPCLETVPEGTPHPRLFTRRLELRDLSVADVRAGAAGCLSGGLPLSTEEIADRLGCGVCSVATALYYPPHLFALTAAGWRLRERPAA